jgi:hypothetical protein
MVTEVDEAAKADEGDTAPQTTDDSKSSEASLGDEPLLGSAQRAKDAVNEQPVPTIESLTADLEAVRKELIDSKQATSTAEGRAKAAGQGDERIAALSEGLETALARMDIMGRQLAEGFRDHESPEAKQAALDKIAQDGQTQTSELAFNAKFTVKQDKFRTLVETTPESDRTSMVDDWTKALKVQQGLPLEKRDLSVFDDLYLKYKEDSLIATVAAAQAETKTVADKAVVDREGLTQRLGVMDNDPGTTTGGGDSDEAFLDRMGSDENAASLQDAIRLREIYSKRGINI